jgi:hypothetical protein
MSKRKTFQTEDVHAVERAISHSNHPDHEEQAISTPEMGSHGVPQKKINAGASQVSMVDRGKKTGAKMPKGSAHHRALADNIRREEGGADPTGGHSNG